MEEEIKLEVKVLINYENKSQKKEAIEMAKQCAISSSILGSVGCLPKKAKLKPSKSKEQKAIEEVLETLTGEGVPNILWIQQRLSEVVK